MKSNDDVRHFHPYNAPDKDDKYTDAKGRRVFFKEDGVPFVFDTRGRKITRFKGDHIYKGHAPTADLAGTTPSNAAVKTYNLQPGQKIPMSGKFDHTKIKHVANVLDSNGNVIHQELFDTRVFDIIDFKDKPLEGKVQNHIRRNTQDYMVAQRMVEMQEKMNKLGISGDIEMKTMIHDDVAIATHMMNRGSDKIKLTRALKPGAYNDSVVFDAMGIRWGNEFTANELLNDVTLSNHVRMNSNKAYMSLRGLGLNPKGDVDPDAVAALFGKKDGRYRLQQSERGLFATYDNSPITFTGNGIDPEWSARIKAAHDAEKSLNQPTEPKYNREPHFNGTEPIMQRNTLNGAPIKTEAEELASNQKILDARDFMNNPDKQQAYLAKERAKAQATLNDPDASDVQKTMAQSVIDEPQKHLQKEIDRNKPTAAKELIKNPGALDRQYTAMTQASKLVLNPNWRTGTDKEQHNQRVTKHLESLSGEDLEALEKRLGFDVLDEENWYKMKFVKTKEWEERMANLEKIKQTKYSPEMKAKLNALTEPMVTDGMESVDDWNQKRLKVTGHIQQNLGGIEAYQYAHKKYTELEAMSDPELLFDKEKKQYYKNLHKEDGTPYRHYLLHTYNVDGEAVVADVRDGIYNHPQDNGKVRPYEYFTPAMIDGENLSKKGLPFIDDNLRERLVLTDIGERELENKQKMASQISENKIVVQEFLDSLKEAKEKNQQEQIKLTKTVQEAFGLKTDTIGSMHAFTAFKKYTQDLEGQGHKVPHMFGNDLTSKRAFDATMNAAYKTRSSFYNSSVYKDIKDWRGNRNTVNNERIEMLNAANEKADIAGWHMGTDLEDDKRVSQERALDNEYRDRHYLLEMEDEHQRQLQRIRNSVEKVNHTNEQAKKKIMNAVHQQMVEGKAISKEDFDKVVAEENAKTMKSILNDFSTIEPDTKSKVEVETLANREARLAELSDFMNRHRQSQGLTRQDELFKDLDVTVDALKSFTDNDPGKLGMPDASQYGFYKKFQEAGIEKDLRLGVIPSELHTQVESMIDTKYKNTITGSSYISSKKGYTSKPDLTDAEIEEFAEWSNRASQVMQFNRNRESVLQMATKKVGDIDNNYEQVSRFAATYDETLADINKTRAKDGHGPLASFVPQEMVQRKANEKSIQGWMQRKEDLAKNEQLFRLEGDKTLYEVKSVHENGTVIAERMVLPAKALDVKLNFEKDLDVIDSMQEANKKLFPAEVAQQYELSEAQKLALDKNRTVRVNQAAKITKDNITELHDTGRHMDMPIQDFWFEMLEGQQAINLGKFTGESKDMKTTIANKRMVDIMGARAGWMLRKGMTDEVTSAMGMAMMESAQEMADKGTPISLEMNNGVMSEFNQEFEDSFVKHLHKNYFKTVGKENNLSASEVLIRDVAKLASDSLQEDPELKGKVGTPEFLHHVESETYRLLNDSSAKMITEDFPYYKEALDTNKIHEVVSKQQDTILSIDDSYVRTTDLRGSAEDVSLNQQMDKIDAQEASDAMSRNEINDMERDRAATGTNITEGRARSEVNNFNRAAKHLSAINAIPQRHLHKLKFTHAKEYFGEDFVNELIEDRKVGRFQMPNEFELLTQYKTARLDVLEKEKGQGYAYDMIRAMHKYDGISDNFFKQAVDETLEPTINNTERLRSYLDLRKAMPGLDLSVGIDADELRRLNPGVTDMIPDGDRFELEVGKNDEIIARSKTTNRTFGIVDTTSSLGEERIVPHELAFNAGSIDHKTIGTVSRTWTKDGTAVASDAIPLAMNSPYNVNRVTRHPMGTGFLSSSDVGTRSGMAQIMNGATAAGVDFETTGLLTNKTLLDRGLILPTEAFVQEGSMTPDGWKAGKGTHLMLDVGEVTDNNGVSVRSIINDEFGKMTGSDLIRETLGEEKEWNTLSAAEKKAVMSSDTMSFVRNIGKYDTAGDVELKNYNYIPDSLDNTFSKWVGHAKMGLDQLSSGAGKTDVDVHRDLESFMQAYDNATKGKVLVMQNGADADIPWANQFAKMSGVDLHEAKPELVEMMHLSRWANPEQRSHSLENQIKRVGGTIEQEYRDGNHLADTDTKAMMRLFGEHYLSNEKLTGENGLTNIDWMKQGDTIVKLGSRGAGKIPHDVYEVQGYGVSDDGMHQLQLTNTEGNTQTLEAPSLQELQRNITQNYKGFGDKDAANKFLSDLTFDDAREDINSAMLSYDDMVRERNRAEGGGVNTGLQRARARYDELQEQHRQGIHGPLEAEDAKILQNNHLFADDYYEPRVNPEYSDRQKRAMTGSKDFFESEDAVRRQDFLGEVKDLEAAGVVNREEGRELVREFNRNIKQKAEAQGLIEKRAVPGLVDLGTVEGKQFGSIAGRSLTALANTHEQAEQELWKVVENFKPLTDPKTHGYENVWKSEALGLLNQHLRQQGILTSGNRMEDAVEAVMARHQQTGDHLVDDLTKPLIQGDNTNAMRQVFQEAHTATMGQVAQRLDERPDLKRSYERTQAMRENFEHQGMAVDKFNYRMASDYEGRNLPLTGEHAFRDALDIKAEIDVLDTSRPQDLQRHQELWTEIYNRATSDYDDKLDAQHIMGWDSTPDNYVHPFAKSGSYLAGTRYADMDMGKGLRDDKNDVNRIRLFSRDGDNPSPLAERASKYIEWAENQGRPINKSVDSGIDDADTTARQVLQKGQGGGMGGDYVDEYTWDRPNGLNRPVSDIDAKTRAGRDAMLEHLQAFTSSNHGKAAGLIAAGLGAAFVARQWTRGDLAEERPEHNSSADGVGSYKSGSPAHQGPAPSGGQTYLAGDNGGVSVQVSAKNRSGANPDQVGQALEQGMNGNASVNVHHRDDMSSINSDWLRDKFAQLLESGYVN